MHLHNIELIKLTKKEENKITKKDCPEPAYQFGFPVKTFCGKIVQENAWNPDWAVSR